MNNQPTPFGSIRQIIKRTPLLGPVLRSVRNYFVSLPPVQKFGFHSADYWESRYAQGGSSGSGSYGPLAEFKAEILNAFVQRHNVRSVVEMGCGDGNQLSLMKYPKYTGLDVSEKAVKLCEARFRDDNTKQFVWYRPETINIASVRSDAALSLDVIYHLVENHIFFSYMSDLFKAAERYVIIYSDNAERQTADVHVRHRKFSDWIDKNRPEWKLVEHVPNRYPYRPGAVEGTWTWADFWIYENANQQS
jgi:SAM-dependent methyltransferase